MTRNKRIQNKKNNRKNQKNNTINNKTTYCIIINTNNSTTICIIINNNNNNNNNGIVCSVSTGRTRADPNVSIDESNVFRLIDAFDCNHAPFAILARWKKCRPYKSSLVSKYFHQNKKNIRQFYIKQCGLGVCT